MVVPVPAEPLPPALIDVGKLHDALVAALGPDGGDGFFEWATVTITGWGRGAARQADAGRVWCRALDARP